MITTNKPDQLLQLLADQHNRFIVTEQRDLPSLPAAVAARFQPLASFEVMKDHMLLLRAKGADSAP